MVNATYETVLRGAEQLTLEEQRELITRLETSTSMLQGVTGVELLAMLDSLPPIDPDMLNEIERIIEEDCERIDPDAWS